MKTVLLLIVLISQGYGQVESVHGFQGMDYITYSDGYFEGIYAPTKLLHDTAYQFLDKFMHELCIVNCVTSVVYSNDSTTQIDVFYIRVGDKVRYGAVQSYFSDSILLYYNNIHPAMILDQDKDGFADSVILTRYHLFSVCKEIMTAKEIMDKPKVGYFIPTVFYAAYKR